MVFPVLSPRLRLIPMSLDGMRWDWSKTTFGIKQAVPEQIPAEISKYHNLTTGGKKTASFSIYISD